MPTIPLADALALAFEIAEAPAQSADAPRGARALLRAAEVVLARASLVCLAVVRTQSPRILRAHTILSLTVLVAVVVLREGVFVLALPVTSLGTRGRDATLNNGTGYSSDGVERDAGLRGKLGASGDDESYVQRLEGDGRGGGGDPLSTFGIVVVCATVEVAVLIVGGASFLNDGCR